MLSCRNVFLKRGNDRRRDTYVYSTHANSPLIIFISLLWLMLSTNIKRLSQFIRVEKKKKKKLKLQLARGSWMLVLVYLFYDLVGRRLAWAFTHQVSENDRHKNLLVLDDTFFRATESVDYYFSLLWLMLSRNSKRLCQFNRIINYPDIISTIYNLLHL